MDTVGWIVAQTKPQRELYAAENLARQNYEHYLPRILVWQKHLSRARLEPLFQSYIFIRYQERWLPILSTYGIARLILRGSEPVMVPEIEIEKIKMREDDDGFVQLDRLRGFRIGQKVRVESGLYEGKEAIYNGPSSQRRAQILMDFLGRKAKVLIDEDLLVAP